MNISGIFFHGLKEMRLFGNSIHILFFHGVVESIRDPVLERNFLSLDEFRNCITQLRQYPIVRLEDVPERLVTGKVRGPSVCITVDDGHRSCLRMAEVLREARIPWSLFVSTGYLGSGGTLWTMELSLMLLYGQSTFFELFDQTWPLDTRRNRVATYESIRSRLKRIPADQRKKEFRLLRDQFCNWDLDEQLEIWPCAQILTWEEADDLCKSGVTIGSHGVFHEIHHQNQLPEVKKTELCESKVAIEQQLGIECKYFSFPNGDFNKDSVCELEKCGYTIGVTTSCYPATSASNLRILPRISQSRILI